MLIEKVLNDIDLARRRAKAGINNSIPNPFPLLARQFVGLEQSRYVIITGSTKSGKTKLANYMFVYSLIEQVISQIISDKIIIYYYTFEDPPERVTKRYIIWLLYRFANMRIDMKELESVNTQNILSDEAYEAMLNNPHIKKRLETFERIITFRNGRTPLEIYGELKNDAMEVGYREKAVDEYGRTIFEYKQRDPELRRIVFIDHIGLLSTEGVNTTRDAINKLSGECIVELRDEWKYSFVVVQQQCVFENHDVAPKKKVPSIANLGDSKVTARDADIIIGIFNPFYCKVDEFEGYRIMDSDTQVGWKNNIRFIEVLANRHGDSQGYIPYKFDGMVSNWEEMRPLNNTFDLTEEEQSELDNAF